MTLSDGSRTIPGVVSCNLTTVTFRPLETLESERTYTVTITSDVKDLINLNLQGNSTWSFTTGTGGGRSFGASMKKKEPEGGICFLTTALRD